MIVNGRLKPGEAVLALGTGGVSIFALQIAKAMGAKTTQINRLITPWNVVPYQSTHNTGGTVTGSDPKTSVLNRYLQSWDVSNVFVMGASTFPQNAGYNPTGTVGALAFWAASAIRSQYLKNPGPLIHA